MPKYITTPLYYVNGKPHLGHAYTSILADFITRYYHLYGEEVMLQTGADEHGQKIYEAARQNGKTPQQYCDEVVETFYELMKKADINYNVFYRTTNQQHITKVQDTLQKLFEKGDIYKDIYKGNYCTPCETFFTEKDLNEGKCPQCGKQTTIIEEENYFFNMEKYAEELKNHIENNPKFIQPNYRKNEVLGILKKGLKPLCISRKKDKMPWGIPIPFDNEFVTYVWFDALTNYINSLDDSAKEYYWPEAIHLIGKDILLHHTIYWPTMLLAMEETLPKHILIHGWWLSEGEKMSKSLGNTIDPIEIIEKYGISTFRFYLLREMTLGQDGNFTTKSFIQKHNTELANDFGNLINRASHFIYKNFDKKIPPCTKKSDFCDNFITTFQDDLSRIKPYLYSFEINKLLDTVMKMVRNTNKYLEDTAPWKLIKINKELCGSVLYNSLEAVRILATLLSPVIPQKINELSKIFMGNFDTSLKWGQLKCNEDIQKSTTLFPKLELPAIQDNAPANTSKEQLIDIKTFSESDIRIGKIINSKKHPDADKLLIFEVDFGSYGKRTIVSGIAKFYSPEETIGKHILAVTNLKPTKIRGVLSNGMILSIKEGKKIKLAEVNIDLKLGKKLI